MAKNIIQHVIKSVSSEFLAIYYVISIPLDRKQNKEL